MNKRGRGIVVLIFIFLLLAAILAFVAFQFFNLETVVVAGNDKYSYEQIVELSGVQKGENILKIDTDQVKANLESVYDIVCRELNILLPNTFEIKIRERKPVLTLQHADSFIVMDEEGFVLDIVSTMPENRPLVSGLNISEMVVGRNIGAEDDFRTITMHNLYTELSDFTILREIAEIDLFNVNSIKLITKNSIVIRIGQADKLRDKLRWATAIYDDLIGSGISQGTIDVSSGEFGTFKKPLETPDSGGQVPETQEPDGGDVGNEPNDDDDPQDGDI